MSNFGASFRKARETAGLPLEKIAAETRISTRFLLAIESEDFHLLPGGIFNRGFVKAYAERLGMDPGQAVADYDRLSATAQEPVDVLRNVERAASRKSDRNLYPIAAAILLVLVVAYYLVTRKSAPRPGETAPQPVAAAEQVPQTAAETTAAPPPEALPQPEVGAAETQTSPAATPATTPAQPVAPVPPPAPEPTRVPAVAAPAASALALDVDAKDQTWIKVTTDGTVAFADILQPGTSRRFSAQRSLDVTIGNAAGAALKINGRDLGQLGTSGQVRELRITPENAAQIH